VTAPGAWPPPGSWAARASAAIEREALAVAQDPAADLATRAAARASLLRPPAAEVMRRYDLALAAMSSAELGALRGALRALVGILDQGTLRLLGGGRPAAWLGADPAADPAAEPESDD